MGKRKTAQKNTLAQWAGVTVAQAVSKSNGSILVFRVSRDKLRKHQGHTIANSRHACARKTSRSLSMSTESDDETYNPSLIDSQSGSLSSLPKSIALEPASIQKQTVDPHPFFSTAKRKLAPGQNDGNRGDAALAALDGNVQPAMSIRPACETHSFFKPRQTTQNIGGVQTETTSLPKQVQQRAACPRRDTMHVVPFEHPSDKASSARRGPKSGLGLCRHFSVREINSASPEPEEWKSPDWEQMVSSLLKRAVPASADTVRTDQRAASTDCKFGDHAALRALANRKLHLNLASVIDEATLWTQKYAPQNATEVLQDGSQALLLRDWLKSRRMHTHDRIQFTLSGKKDPFGKYAEAGEDWIVDDDLQNPLTSDIGAEFDAAVDVSYPPGRETLFKSHLIILTGPTGCGKSAAIQAVAKELAFEIFEVNSTERRSGKDVVEQVGEASQSHMVNKQRSADGSRSRSLILFEEVDVLYRDDKDFWAAVLLLASSSKRPIVLTCSDVSVLPKHLDMPSVFVEFSTPSPALSTDYLQALLAVESVHLDREEIVRYLKYHSGDLRATINDLQFRTLRARPEVDIGPDCVSQELLSCQMSVSALYHSKLPSQQSSSSSQSLLKAFGKLSNKLSCVDLIATQQRSSALESPESYENDTEEELARVSGRDDLIGQQIIDEPYGRYTRLHPGDLDVATPFAFMVQELMSEEVQLRLPTWVLRRGSQLSPNRTSEVDTVNNWDAIVHASAPFSEPENWMYDFTPHSCIDRPAISGILATDVLPYLRSMTQSDDRQDAWERATLASHSGRTTRNTMSNEYGFKRKTKILSSLRGAINATRLGYRH